MTSHPQIRSSRTLKWVSGASLILVLIAAVGLFVDPRQILGAPAWSKTLKFAISLFLYAYTLNWVTTVLPQKAKLVRGLFRATSVILVLEVILIVIQTVRGVPSHFNVSTSFDTIIWGAMGSMISVFWVLSFVAAVLVLFQRTSNPVVTWSIRLGLILSLVGFMEGYLMASPNPLQQQALQAGQQLDLIGAHTVGVLKDGGKGLPIVGWSTEHGDLRIAHFIGTHALQVMPLLALFLIGLRRRWLQDRQRIQLLLVGAAGYLGLMGLLVWQALRDESILNPSSPILYSGGGLLLVMGVLVTGIVVSARNQLKLRRPLATD
ncbi:hypothetical protein [Deinococcus cellulosilyticus]|uniref:Uncharacterized protein n=1 Tax=Deinococcus cellulosilyticus (strain DSM 18568 / NBRC 106333 / KACC 11606 / 5516J-15) TaxID=1223518 RepID=A0A511N2T0_DEIC1|nr:hypothetical protein [Deinococcus cellulosilyticus]GEM46817.1 hypothetical protein DC3_24520 [Deinococcus cellulosilyticus NBRC 106333 = KACC 11606]